ncbi:MAG TPA: GNAT family N-acetyltransferase [Steroidobacteraceae bacterium]|nr:GNAT family N-acetyltransferase [Steroidobacteraceae bacterium]
MTIAVQHDPDAREFFADIDGERPILQYHLAGTQMSIVHTGVPPALANRGIAAELTRTALEYARAQGWKVVPACSYAAAYLRMHPEYDDLVSRHAGGMR